jgi:tRNA (guanine-N7-)-methyltransferase
MAEPGPTAEEPEIPARATNSSGSYPRNSAISRHRDPHFTSETAPTTGRAARSFRPRSGRLSATKYQAITNYLPNYLIEPCTTADLGTIFGRTAPLVLDIGFGMGESTLAVAQAHPEWNVLAIDVHIAGHAMLARGLHNGGVTNVRIVAADAHEVLLWMLAPRSVREVLIWFSDPWPKQAQSWRRLVQPDFVQLMTGRMEIGGVVRMATDWQPYADQMRRCIDAETGLKNPYSTDGGWAPRDPLRPITGFERKGLRAGRTIRDLVAEAMPPPATERLAVNREAVR